MVEIIRVRSLIIDIPFPDLVQLNKWDTNERLFKDYLQLKSGVLSLNAFCQKQENEAVAMKYSMSPETMDDYLHEVNFIDFSSPPIVLPRTENFFTPCPAVLLSPLSQDKTQGKK